MQSAWCSKVSPPPAVELRPEDFRLRFAIAGYNISDKDLERAPAAVHCNGKIGYVSVSFDLQLIRTIAYPAQSRSRPMPEIWYASDHFNIYTAQLLNKQGLRDQKLRFGLPWVLRGFAGPSTTFEAELFIRGQWHFTGFNSFENGMVELDIDYPPNAHVEGTASHTPDRTASTARPH